MLKNVSSSNLQNQARRQMKSTADLDQVFLEVQHYRIMIGMEEDESCPKEKEQSIKCQD